MSPTVSAATASPADAASLQRRVVERDRQEGWQRMEGMMDSLVQFCIDQRSAFDAAAWLARFEDVGEPLALAAKYLSMTSWYGHEAELERICAATRVFADNSNGLHVESRAMDFDLNAFSIRVRLGLAQARRAPRGAKQQPAQPLWDDA